MREITLPESPLFRGIPSAETENLLSCLGAERRQYAKGQSILRAGDVVTSLGLVLSGAVHIVREDFWGNRTIVGLAESGEVFDDFWGNATVLDHVGPGQIFAETYACTPGEPLMVFVTAAEAAEILFLNMARVLQTCPHACASHGQLIRNLLALSAQKNLHLSRKIFHTAPRTIRGRLLSYLSDEAMRAGSRSFTIPFNRQQLADYLHVDRSALSHELGNMQREGLLRVRKNQFELKSGCQDFGL